MAQARLPCRDDRQLSVAAAASSNAMLSREAPSIDACNDAVVVLALPQSTSVPRPDLPTTMTPFLPRCEAAPAAGRLLDAAAPPSRRHRTRRCLHDLPCRRGGWTCSRRTRHPLHDAGNTGGPRRRAARCPRRRAPWPTSHVSCVCLDKRCAHYRRMQRHGALLPPMPQQCQGA